MLRILERVFALKLVGQAEVPDANGFVGSKVGQYRLLHNQPVSLVDCFDASVNRN